MTISPKRTRKGVLLAWFALPATVALIWWLGFTQGLSRLTGTEQGSRSIASEPEAPGLSPDVPPQPF